MKVNFAVVPSAGFRITKINKYGGQKQLCETGKPVLYTRWVGPHQSIRGRLDRSYHTAGTLRYSSG